MSDELDDRVRSLLAERHRPMARWQAGAPPRPGMSRVDEDLRRAEARLVAAEMTAAADRLDAATAGLRLVEGAA